MKSQAERRLPWCFVLTSYKNKAHTSFFVFVFTGVYFKTVPGLPDLPNWETVKAALDPEVQNVLMEVFDLFLRCVVPDVEWKVNFETKEKISGITSR